MKQKAKKPVLTDEELLSLKREELLLKEKEIELMEGLPFLYGWKWYPWARTFYESTNKLNFLCAANQISKSSTQIRKCIDWATNQEKWPRLWGKRPTQFWYLYPSANQCTIEFETKWVEFLPRGKYKDDPVYGWTKVIKNKEIWAIKFNSGVTVYFKSYSQSAENLQTGTVDAMFCDEELDVAIYNELMFRLSSSNGYFHMVFTATLGQDFWRRVIEPATEGEELLKSALKIQVSMYDCQLYEDGTPSQWTTERINQVIARCSSQNEVLRRVYGKFVVDSGLKYPQFDVTRHVREKEKIPDDWFIYGAVDPGSGGQNGHPAAMVIVAVRPDFKFGRVIKGWRGDGVETAASDILQKYKELKGKMKTSGQWYDWSSKEFEIISTRMGEPFQMADKGRDKGEMIVNTLFKNDMLVVDEDEELSKLAQELSTLQQSTPKTKAKDDYCDALRYGVVKIPWDWSDVGVVMESEKVDARTPTQKHVDERRAAFFQEKTPEQSLEEEFEELNDLYG